MGQPPPPRPVRRGRRAGWRSRRIAGATRPRSALEAARQRRGVALVLDLPSALGRGGGSRARGGLRAAVEARGCAVRRRGLARRATRPRAAARCRGDRLLPESPGRVLEGDRRRSARRARALHAPAGLPRHPATARLGSGEAISVDRQHPTVGGSDLPRRGWQVGAGASENPRRAMGRPPSNSATDRQRGPNRCHWQCRGSRSGRCYASDGSKRRDRLVASAGSSRGLPWVLTALSSIELAGQGR